MKIKQITVLLLVGLLSLAAIADDPQDPRYQALGPFNAMRASGDVDIHIMSDPGQHSVRIEGEAKGEVEFKVINNTLYIQKKSSIMNKLPSERQQQKSRTRVTVQLDNLHALSYTGQGNLIAENFKSAVLDLTVNTRGKVKLSGQIGLHDLQVRGLGEINIEGINSRDLAVTMTGGPKVVLSGNIALKALNYSGSGKLSMSGVDSAELIVNGSGSASAQLTGKTEKLIVKLTENSHFNGKRLYAQQAYIKTYQQSCAEISVINKQNTLASDQSNIYYYQDPDFKTDLMADDGSVLNRVNVPAQQDQLLK